MIALPHNNQNQDQTRKSFIQTALIGAMKDEVLCCSLSMNDSNLILTLVIKSLVIGII